MEVHSRLEVLAKAKHSYHVEGRILEARSLSLSQLFDGITLGNMLQAFVSTADVQDPGKHQTLCLPVAGCQAEVVSVQQTQASEESSEDAGQAGCLHRCINVQGLCSAMGSQGVRQAVRHGNAAL